MQCNVGRWVVVWHKFLLLFICEAECNTEGFYCRNLCKEETLYKSYGKFGSQLSFMHECEAECNTKGSYCGNLCKAEIIRKVLWHSAVSFPVFPPIHNQQYSDWCMNSFRITSLLLKKKQEGTSHVFSEGTSMMMEWDFNHLYENHEGSYPKKTVYQSHLYTPLQNCVVWNNTNLQ